MMDEATGVNPPFKAILVHSLSRFSRASEELAGCMKRLWDNGVSTVSTENDSEQHD